MANKVVTYDAETLSNAEILAPQIDKTKPMLAIRALRQAYGNAETMDAVKRVLGNREQIRYGEADYLMRAAAAVVSAERNAKKAAATVKTGDQSPRIMDAAAINALNKKIYGA